MKKLFALAGALALATGALMVTGASADTAEAPPADVAAVATTSEAPAPAAEPEAAKAQKNKPTETGHTPVTFCHKPGTPAQQELTTDDDGFLEGHLGHGDTLGPCPSKPDQPATYTEYGEWGEWTYNCETGAERGRWTWEVSYTWNADTWTWDAVFGPDVAELETRPLTNDEKAQLDCAKPEQPVDTVVTRDKVTESCAKNIIVTDHYETWTRWTFDVASWTWVPTTEAEIHAGKDVQTNAFTAEECGYEPIERLKETPVCKAGVVVIDRYLTYTVWDVSSKSWVQAKEKWDSKTNRPLTAEEQAVCAGDQPDPIIETRNVTGDPNCQALTITTEHQTRTREYVLDGSEWVPGEWSEWETTSTTVADDTKLDSCAKTLETEHEVSCGVATVSLHNHTPWLYRVLIEQQDADGNWTRADVLVVDNRGDAPNDSTDSLTVTFPEDSGVQAIRYKVSSGGESDLYVGQPVGEFTTVAVESDCEANPPVEIELTAIPTATAPTCETDGALVLPVQENVTFSSTPEGTGPGIYQVTATAADGYVISGDTSWEITVLPRGASQDCSVDTTTPVTTTPEVPTETETETATETETTTATETPVPSTEVETSTVVVETTDVAVVTSTEVQAPAPAPVQTPKADAPVIPTAQVFIPKGTTPEASTTATPTSSVTVTETGGLAYTGANKFTWVIAALGLALLAGGAVFVAAARGRRTNR